MGYQKNRRLVYVALLAAQAIVLSILEGFLPPLFPFAPGAKLGMANLIIVIALFTLPVKYSAQVLLIRIIVTMLIGGTFSTLMYSLAGGLLSYLAMLLAKQLGPRWISIVGISVVGGVMHNFGQLLVVAFFARSWAALNYLPVLSLSGIAAGIVVGLLGNFLLVKIDALRLYHRELSEQTQQTNWLEGGNVS